ncbi:MAG: hypothetical protein HY822_11685 [Acidobacteria bacterium]|nr:hypothetical protein [Acidobacteriota bacterium]
MLVNFDDDPRYECVEPQAFDDMEHGQGLAVLVYRRDGKVDAHFQPGLRLPRDAFAIGQGLGAFVETAMDAAHFEITPRGVDLDLRFTDVHGQLIEVRIAEDGSRSVAPMALLAPVGNAIVNPKFFPLFFLYGVKFVPRAGTRVSIRIGGAARRPARFAIPLGATSCYGLRYVAEPFLFWWNLAQDGPLAPLCPPGAGTFSAGDALYELAERAGHLEIASIRVARAARALAMEFQPAFPDLAGLGDGAAAEGRFTIHASGDAGRLGGAWRAARRGARISVSLQLTGGWRSAERSLLFRLLFWMPMFRRWVDSYRWSAVLERHPDGRMSMRSAWGR